MMKIINIFYILLQITISYYTIHNNRNLLCLLTLNILYISSMYSKWRTNIHQYGKKRMFKTNLLIFIPWFRNIHRTKSRKCILNESSPKQLWSLPDALRSTKHIHSRRTRPRFRVSLPPLHLHRNLVNSARRHRGTATTTTATIRSERFCALWRASLDSAMQLYSRQLSARAGVTHLTRQIVLSDGFMRAARRRLDRKECSWGMAALRRVKGEREREREREREKRNAPEREFRVCGCVVVERWFSLRLENGNLRERVCRKRDRFG